MKNSAFLLVNQEVLPQVFTKVIQAKEYLRTAQASSTTEAAKMAGISRSVFYKYKDAVYPYHGKAEKQIVTIQVVLYDRPGVLMAVTTWRIRFFPSFCFSRSFFLRLISPP